MAGRGDGKRRIGAPFCSELGLCLRGGKGPRSVVEALKGYEAEVRSRGPHQRPQSASCNTEQAPDQSAAL